MTGSRAESDVLRGRMAGFLLAGAAVLARSRIDGEIRWLRLVQQRSCKEESEEDGKREAWERKKAEEVKNLGIGEMREEGPFDERIGS
jgi:hypothetical protein